MPRTKPKELVFTAPTKNQAKAARMKRKDIMALKKGKKSKNVLNDDLDNLPLSIRRIISHPYKAKIPKNNDDLDNLPLSIRRIISHPYKAKASEKSTKPQLKTKRSSPKPPKTQEMTEEKKKIMQKLQEEFQRPEFQDVSNSVRAEHIKWFTESLMRVRRKRNLSSIRLKFSKGGKIQLTSKYAEPKKPMKLNYTGLCEMSQEQKNKIIRTLLKDFETKVFKGKFSGLKILWKTGRKWTSYAGYTTYDYDPWVPSASVQIIELSETLVTTEPRLRMVFLHELCHYAAMVRGEHDGHGPNWRSWVRKTEAAFPGIKITRTHTYSKPEIEALDAGTSCAR